MTTGVRANELAALGLARPTLLLDPQKARRNIERMAHKAAAAGVRFRPHFKTHQSAAIGAWFRDVGVEAITVSSLDMALYFAAHGWRDITVAFPANVLESDKIDTLARDIALHLVVDTSETVAELARRVRHRVQVWIKVDVGAGRTGVPWDDSASIVDMARELRRAPRLACAGLLTHAGHSYGADSTAAVLDIHATSIARLLQLRTTWESAGLGPCALSIGDTPCCSLAGSFAGVDEIRPGNFVFYDLTQVALGACAPEDVAVAVACPVVSKSRARQQLVLYGGAVHLSKEALHLPGNHAVHGRLAQWNGQAWDGVEPSTAVVSLSQEHGLVDVDARTFAAVHPGDLVIVLPVHSCLTSDLYTEYRTLRGERLSRRQSNQTV